LRHRLIILVAVVSLATAAGLAACAAPAPAPADRVAMEQSRLETFLERRARRGFTGQVLVARGTTVLVMGGYGVLRPGSEAPVTADSIMPLASLTKPFTASAVLALAADGRLRLDDPIGMHLPGLDAPWRDVPIAHFLLHTAGLPAEIVNRAWDGHPWFEPVARDEFIAQLRHFPPDHPPGDVFNYSNVGYSVLGALIEHVSGDTWERYLRERLLAPSGIRHIGLLAPEWPREKLVHGREQGRDRGSYFDQPRLSDGLGWRLRASGDLQGSAAAMMGWWQGIRDGRWLPPDWLSTWITPRVDEPDGSSYGYGLHFRDSPAGPVIGHTGGDGIFSADWSWFVEPDILIYVASADPRHPADDLRDAMLPLLDRPPPRRRNRPARRHA
jgi:CubicO group peptidase (beta-lactamase class C family)